MNRPVPAADPGPAVDAAVASLVHALHEGRLDDAGLSELERRALSDPAAMRAYLDLTAVHGTLTHDAGTLSAPSLPALRWQDGPGKGVPEKTVATPPSAAARWRTPLTVAASVALLCGLAFAVRPGPAGGPAELAGTDLPGEPVLRPAFVPERSVEPAPRPAAEDRRPTPDFFPDTPRLADAAPPERTPEAPADPRPVAPQPVAPPAALAGEIDAALAASWEEAEATPSPEAAPGEWLRRAWLDLAGHAPPPTAVARFLSDDRPDRRERELDRLLAGDAFAEHLAERWTTALVGRSPRDGVDRPGLRAHLADQFGRNVGWDLVAADLIAAIGSVTEAPAANFLVAHVNNQAVPATAVTARVLLGTRVQCMQCHDHPQNGGAEWSQDRFWELNAFFKGTDVVRRPGDGGPVAALEATAAGGPTFFATRRGVMKATFPKFAGQTVEAAAGRREKLAELLLSDDRRLPARSFVNRTWAHLFGAGLVNPVDDLGPHNPPSHPAVLEALTDRFVATGYDVRDLYATLTATRLYRLSGAATDGNSFDDPSAGEVPLFTRCYPKPLTVEQTFDSLAAVAGRPTDPAARDDWVAGFVRSQGNDENAEDLAAVTDIPRALALMNGPATDAAMTDAAVTARETGGGRGAAGLGGQSDLDGVFLAALSRRPTPRERRRLAPLLRVPGGLDDLRWALLNSGEFATVP